MSPFTGEVVGEVGYVDAAAAQRALDAAVEAQETVASEYPAFRRAEILQRTADLVHAAAESLALTIAVEGGKPLRDARAEVARVENTVRLAAEEATRIQGSEIPMQGTDAALGRLAFTTREPIGVVMAVSAFNHPLNLIAHQVAPAIAAGCPVLVKPASDTPLSCVRFIELLREAGLPPELAMAVPCANDIAQELVSSDRIAFFSFIGSPRVGWYLRSQLAAGVRCALEHGGAAPAIVDASADLDTTIPLLTKGAFYHAGQVCVSVQRILAEQTCAADLASRLADAAGDLVVGDPTSERTDVGPLIREREVERVHDWVQEAVREGGELLCGGEPLGNGCYAPTVLVNPPADAKVMTEEVFGPVVCVSEWESLDDAIERANDVRWAFQAAVFSRDIDVALRAARRLDATAVMVNDHTAFRVDWMPFGGRGASGLSMGGIAPAIEELTQEKMVVLRSPGL
ncbi:aldehyde dehydrogenase family protein [Candidatus Poribacteria bacterium]|nr:aldehyde dehydrogenase family protein [Candidatus Poribacteria bacterium]MBT5534992.1 aldehyde dehydrogenase family protein [Candidatus Poribacteria bacterium]MBT5713883.1 aldehyde dehydrogenase family protein [Candidatus Poribacteria bacterium]MBT7100333.1 aldehyde dehydrogenase family protein [Candidatus Poribacteria bacterium]MBT7809531.1 aldehyde dehydrogenase family protein [Candidatus Poribacteria bacterium]